MLIVLYLFRDDDDHVDWLLAHHKFQVYCIGRFMDSKPGRFWPVLPKILNTYLKVKYFPHT